MGKTKQDLRGAERKRREDGETERGESVSYMAYQVCWFYHRGSWLQSLHGLLTQKQHLIEALFFQAYWETFCNTPQAMALTLFTWNSYVVFISQGGDVHPEDCEVGIR